MFASSNNYKNAVKRLRKINSSLLCEREKRCVGNYYKYLSKLEEEEQEESEEPEEQEKEEQKQDFKEIVREKRVAIDFNDLPEDTIYKILEFLSANTRLAILKRKYNRNFIKCTLQKLPETNEELTKMWRCAVIAYNLLQSVLDDNSMMFKDTCFSYSVRFFKKEKNPSIYSRYYKERFIEIILTTIRHYSRIYKFGSYTNKKVIQHIEQIMLNVFAHLSKIR
jgi:hypothetical protein